MTKRYAFIFTKNCFQIHHGVRRYLLTLIWHMRKIGYHVDILYWDNTIGSNGKLEVIELGENFFLNNGFNFSKLVATSRDAILKILKENLSSVFELPIIESFLTQKKCPISALPYDACILSGPWTYDINIPLPFSKEYFCIAYDAIPNQYYFSEPDNANLKIFAFQHQRGYKWADDFGNGILCISSSTKHTCIDFGFGLKKGLYVIKRLSPLGFNTITKEEIISPRAPVALLAAPFDPRKGMDIIPEIINASRFEKLIIFGRPRCKKESLVKFFENIKMENIEWWLQVDLNTQKRLYLESKVLIFPSVDEGLGLPVLEAHATGVRVLVSENVPSSRSFFPPEDICSNVEDLKKKALQISKEKQNHEMYWEYAQKSWNQLNYGDIIWE